MKNKKRVSRKGIRKEGTFDAIAMEESKIRKDDKVKNDTEGERKTEAGSGVCKERDGRGL